MVQSLLIFFKINMLFKIRSGQFCLPSVFWTNQCCLCMQPEALLSGCVDGSGGSGPSDTRGARSCRPLDKGGQVSKKFFFGPSGLSLI